ncbi:hypothetical protein ACQ4M3_20525 [Leptolyngbya sp. AN03gr2]|uniref:hypothetical protein n=1 Tax=unclassified Leptolyngbya TaxID=2650499 RepID=UPI003D310D02
MQRDVERDFVKVNKILGKQASIGFIPAEQLIPFIAIAIVCYVLTNGLLSLGNVWFGVSTFWLGLSWWLLTGKEPYRFTDKFRNPPGGKTGGDWIDIRNLYISPIAKFRPPYIRTRVPDDRIRIRLKPLSVPKLSGGKSTFMPFQNELNLCCIAEIKKDDREIAAFLLEQGEQYQLVFGFYNDGIHDVLYSNEIAEISRAIEEGTKELPHGERVTFCTGSYSNDKQRQQEISEQAANCKLPPVSVLLRNEQLRIQELSRKGTRQTWSQIIFCTWTAGKDGTNYRNDPLGRMIAGISKMTNNLLSMISDNKRFYEEEFYKSLLLKAYQEGFVQWELTLGTKIGLPIRACNSKELWEWLWNRFNDAPAPEIPQVLTLEETHKGVEISERKTTEKHPVTVLIEGWNGKSSCPQHNNNTNRVYIPGKAKECAVLTMADAPEGWVNTREQIKWIWKITSAPFVHNTESWIELSTTNNVIIQDNLARQAKQSKAARTRAITKGQGRDIGAEVKAEESFEAQRKIYEGSRAINCAPVFVVYRNTAEELTHACDLMCNSFDSARVLREDNIAWDIWLQTLPVTSKWLLHSSDFLSQRRLVPDTQTIAGLLPLTTPNNIDRKGVEFLTSRGGKPIYIDLFSGEAKRALIIGTSGSGKSVTAWRFMLDALGQNIPVVGMDISSGTNSTFKVAVELLGSQGAYYDISKGSSNLLEPPDLRKFKGNREELETRLNSWKEFIRKALTAISMGKLHDPALAQRVDALLLKMLDMFLRDPEIIDRYNKAFEQGWKSPEWQQMPVLKDLLSFCSRERLNLQSFEQIDARALNQINSQISALLVSRLGKAVGRPSSFSPEPAVKFFGLSDLSNEQDAYLMAISAHTACIRNALSHPKSLFVGDELSVLLKKEGFAQIVGETCATGRKEGIAMLLLAQDPDSIALCATGSQIIQNMNYRLTGRITHGAIPSYEKFFGYPRSIIAKNASDAYRPKPDEMCSCWIIETLGRFWEVKFYPGEMVLASVANNHEEVAARNRIMMLYPNTAKGRLMAMSHFSRELFQARHEGNSLKTIGSPESAAMHIVKKSTKQAPSAKTEGSQPHSKKAS